MKTISGNSNTEGSVVLPVTIFNKKEDCLFFIIKSKSFEDDVLLGLDCIKKFRLCQDENLKISQNLEKAAEINIVKGNFECKNNEIDEIKSDLVLKEILGIYKDVFAKEKFDIGKVNDYEAAIRLTENKYVAKRPYGCSLQDKAEIEKQIKELLKSGLIEESSSPYASPVTLAFKKDENKRSRLCIDYRELNKIVVPESHPFPRIDELKLRARNCNYFTKLDMNSAFWSIQLRDKDKYKTAFVTHHGHWQWNCLPFGLKSAPAIFQRTLSSILRKNSLDSFAVNYIDDILIYSNNYEDHMQHTELVLKTLRSYGFKLNVSKCIFAKREVSYLGHKIGYNSIKPLNDNVVAIKNFPVPQTRKNIRQFLGKLNFYLQYIPNSSIVLEPFHNLLRKNVQFDWSPSCQENFEMVKEHLCSEPILSIFDPALPTYIFTDASIQGVGAVLKQRQEDKKLKPVFYFSRRLNNTQKEKKAIFIECLAIKEAILYWQYYLIGQKFTVFTDHKPLEGFKINNCNDPELRKILTYISQFNCEILYNPGKENLEADCLSRNPVLEEEEDNFESSAVKIVNFLEINEIINDQKNFHLDNKCEKKNGIIYRSLNNKEKIWLSEAFGKQLIKKVHEIRGHVGVKQMFLTITTKFYFKNMHKHIKIFCRACETCIKNKTRIANYKVPLSQLGPASKPFEIVSLDTVGGFAGNKSTKKYLHLLTDHFTRYAFITTSSTQTADNFIKLVKSTKNTNKIDTLISDQYAGINSNDFKKYLKSENIRLIFTAVDCAFSNGLNERTNQTLVNRIRCKIYENKTRSWPAIAQECVHEYNNTIHSSTGFTPSYLLTGKEESILPDELNENNVENLDENRRKAFEQSKKIHEQNRRYYDEKTNKHEYNENDLIYINNGNKLNRKKTDPIREGPFRIKRKISEVIYEVDSGLRKKGSNLFHASKLIPFH